MDVLLSELLLLSGEKLLKDVSMNESKRATERLGIYHSLHTAVLRLFGSTLRR